VLALQKHPNEVIAQLAKKFIQQWLGALYSHIGTLASVYQRPIPQPMRNKTGYGPPKDAADKDEKSQPNLRNRAPTPPPTVSGTKRNAEEGFPASAAKATPPAKVQRNSAGLPGCTPVGKGHKLCSQCNGTCGSPTRVCPHCGATLPTKVKPKKEGD